MGIVVEYSPAMSSIRTEDMGLFSRLVKDFSFENPDYNEEHATECAAEGKDYPHEPTFSFVREHDCCIPTGLYWALKDWASARSVEVDFVRFPEYFETPTKEEGIDPKIIPGITLHNYQIEVADACIRNKRGVVEVATGGGKSEICVALTLHFGQKTLCITPDQAAMKNLYDRFESKDLGKMTVGRLGSGHRELDADIVVAVINSLNSGLVRRDEEVLCLLEESSVLFSDEAHHQKAASWIRVASSCLAERRFFLSGTPYKDDKTRNDPGRLHEEDSWLVGLSGKNIYYLPPRELIKRGILSRGSFVSIPMGGNVYRKIKHYPAVYQKGIVQNLDRNVQICALVDNLVHLGRVPLISIEKLEHGHGLQRDLWKDYGVPSALFFRFWRSLRSKRGRQRTRGGTSEKEEG